MLIVLAAYHIYNSVQEYATPFWLYKYEYHSSYDNKGELPQSTTFKKSLCVCTTVLINELNNI